MGIDVKGVTIVGIQSAATPTTATTVGPAGAVTLNTTTTTLNLINPSNVTKNQKENKNKRKKPNGTNVIGNHRLTTSPRPSASAEINNPFAYLATLLANSIETSVFIAPSPQKTHKNARRKNHRRKTTKTMQRVPTTAADPGLLSLPPQPLYTLRGRNGSNILQAAAATEQISEGTLSDHQLNTQTPESLDERDYRILSKPSNYVGYSDGAGKGRFSCLVEAVESQCDCGWSTHSLKVVSAFGMAGPNEYSSMAGILTVKYGKIFCGAVISEYFFRISV